jgi:hypothetical protein
MVMFARLVTGRFGPLSENATHAAIAARPGWLTRLLASVFRRPRKA